MPPRRKLPTKTKGPIYGPFRASTPGIMPSLARLLPPNMQPRAKAVKGTIQLKFGGGPWKSIAQHLEEASLPPQVLKVLGNIQTRIQNPLLSLFPTEGRLATFEQARALAEAKRVTDTGSGHFAPATKKSKPRPEKRKTPVTSEQRYLRDVGGSIYEPSKIEKITDPAINRYIESARRLIEGSSTSRPQTSARSIKKLFEKIDNDVSGGRISKDVGDAIRNRVVESLMQSGAGDVLLPTLALSSGTGGRRMAQTQAGELVRRSKPTTEPPDEAARVLDALDLAAEREGLALRGKSRDTRRLPGPADVDPLLSGAVPAALAVRGSKGTKADQRMRSIQSDALTWLFRLLNPVRLNVSPTSPSFGMKGTSSEIGRIATPEELAAATTAMDRLHALQSRPGGPLLRAGLIPKEARGGRMSNSNAEPTPEEVRAMMDRIRNLKKRNLRVGRKPATSKKD